MRLSDITLSNIISFVEGNYFFYLDKFKKIPSHRKEQALYRMSKCKNDCLKQGKCIKCGCPTEKKVFATKSCNYARFPDLMDEKEWNDFKAKNKIQ